jgi:hypothetical protein
MKKMILMAAFAAFAFAANAQTEPTASTSGKATDKKECANKSASCCSKAATGTASTAAAVTPEVKSVSKSKAAVQVAKQKLLAAKQKLRKRLISNYLSLCQTKTAFPIRFGEAVFLFRNNYFLRKYLIINT